jgi:hypothetical protein
MQETTPRYSHSHLSEDMGVIIREHPRVDRAFSLVDVLAEMLQKPGLVLSVLENSQTPSISNLALRGMV